MFPLDPRHAVVAPKYNPTRTWTPEGALGLGGPCFAIYPVESAGGYQLIGRTIPIYDLAQRNAAFRENPLLMRAGDRVVFHRIEEDELLACSRTCAPTATATASRTEPSTSARSSSVDAKAEEEAESAAPPRASRRRDAGSVRGERGEQSVEVLEGGIQTTVQDYPGRLGMLAQGFFPAGPMDHFALRAANLLVGNAESAAALEVTLGGLALRLDADATVAVCGAEADARARRRAAALWESHASPAARSSGSASPRAGLPHVRRSTGAARRRPLLGSRATYTMGALGGSRGRALAPATCCRSARSPTARQRPARFKPERAAGTHASGRSRRCAVPRPTPTT